MTLIGILNDSKDYYIKNYSLSVIFIMFSM